MIVARGRVQLEDQMEKIRFGARQLVGGQLEQVGAVSEQQVDKTPGVNQPVDRYLTKKLRF